MNLSKKWMSDYVTLDVTDKQFADGMTISGSKVEGFEKGFNRMLALLYNRKYGSLSMSLFYKHNKID